MTQLVLPVGYRRGVGGGSVPSPADESLVVRRGTTNFRLSADEAIVWDEVLPIFAGLDRSEIAVTAWKFGAAEPDAVIDSLIARRLAMVIADDSDDAGALERATRGLRFVPLRAAAEYGAAGDFSLRRQWFTADGAIVLDELEHVVWRDAPDAPTIWEATGDGRLLDALAADRVERVEVALSAICSLLRSRSGYLDIPATAGDPVPASGGLDEEEYHTFVTGNPPGVAAYGEANGVGFDFDGVIDGRPVYTIASLATRFAGRPAPRFWAPVIVEVAALQLAVSHGREPIWAVQHAADARLASDVLAAHGVDRIEVRHLPAR